ncbi:alpha/beta hydrolase [Microbacterium sp. LWH11-1.2]|uniref:alpha/beta hydrolase n=1 Tax=Microbacterium sp. LWH11-1.2 TaxID=3135258 RepID=UPI00313915D7
MPFDLDPAVAHLIALGAGPAQPEDFREGDHRRLRAILDDGLAQMRSLPGNPEVLSRSFTAPAPDGHPVRMTWYSIGDVPPGSAVVHFHGGARVAGSVDLYGPLISTYVAWTGVPMLSVDYRLAPEGGAESAALDGMTAVAWLHENAERLGVARDRIAVMGDSAGGGVAASVAIAARDAGIRLARQILIYPMLDDRVPPPDPHLAASPTLFSYAYSRTAWQAVLSSLELGSEPTHLAAAGRNTRFADLAPAFIEVGEMDIFRDENVGYAQRLWAAGVSTELHVHPGMPHAYDVLLLGDDAYQSGKVRAIRSL